MIEKISLKKSTVIDVLYQPTEEIFTNHIIREQFVSALNNSVKHNDIYYLHEFIECITIRNLFIDDIIKDAKGECLMALKPEYYSKWGFHYLQSIINAHSKQLRNNFKDPGVQHYGSTDIYNKLRDDINTIFNDLPAPKPSKITVYNSHQYSNIQSMSSYNMSSNGCFARICPVLVVKDLNATQVIVVTKNISELVVGDLVVVDKEPYQYARVSHIVVSQSDTPIKMVKISRTFIITPWHPIIFNGKWIFPQSLVEQGLAQEIDYKEDVYNIALESNHQILVDGFLCITLGHGITNDPVATHPYFGTSKVIDDLNKMKITNGKIYLNKSNIKRDETTKLICGIE